MQNWTPSTKREYLSSWTCSQCNREHVEAHRHCRCDRADLDSRAPLLLIRWQGLEKNQDLVPSSALSCMLMNGDSPLMPIVGGHSLCLTAEVSRKPQKPFGTTINTLKPITHNGRDQETHNYLTIFMWIPSKVLRLVRDTQLIPNTRHYSSHSSLVNTPQKYKHTSL